MMPELPSVAQTLELMRRRHTARSHSRELDPAGRSRCDRRRRSLGSVCRKPTAVGTRHHLRCRDQASAEGSVSCRCCEARREIPHRERAAGRPTARTDRDRRRRRRAYEEFVRERRRDRLDCARGTSPAWPRRRDPEPAARGYRLRTHKHLACPAGTRAANSRTSGGQAVDPRSLP